MYNFGNKSNQLDEIQNTESSNYYQGKKFNF